MLKDTSSALIIVLILVIGGLAYLLLPGRLNGPASTQTSTSTATSTVIGTTTSSDLQSTSTYNTYEQTGS